MSQPRVSVVIPAYNQADFIGKSIQSVLSQTYTDFEIIIVNDASSDRTTEVIKQFKNPRLQYIEHEENRGLPATRNSGMRASAGEYIALLDADDFFHPEKLQTHVEFLNSHPDVGVSYNPRFDLNHSAETVRGLWRPPRSVGLRDFVLGFPFSPSDMVIRKEWALQVDFFDETLVNGGEDTDLPCRLALSGCKFASVDRALNYRRYHSGKPRKNLPGRLDDVVRALNRTYDDPRCPPEILSLRDSAIKHHLMVLLFLAFIQEETELGKKYLRDLIEVDPSVIIGDPNELVTYLISESIADENLSHEDLLQSIFSQMPSELSWLSKEYDWAVARGYLLKGIRAVIWDRPEDGREHFNQAIALNAKLDESILRMLAYDLLSYELEFGSEAAEEVLNYLIPYLSRLGNRGHLRRLRAYLSINRGFRDHRAGRSASARAQMKQAIINNPQFLADRGVWSVLLRSYL